MINLIEYTNKKLMKEKVTKHLKDKMIRVKKISIRIIKINKN